MSSDRISIRLAIVLVLPLLGVVPIAAADSGNSFRIPELNDSNVNNALREFPVLALDCYVPECGPCTVLNSTLLELSSELNGQVAIAQINIRENNVTKNMYKINAYPTTLDIQ